LTSFFNSPLGTPLKNQYSSREIGYVPLETVSSDGLTVWSSSAFFIAANFTPLAQAIPP